MWHSNSFLTVNFGAGSLKLAEFEVNEAGGLRLKEYGLRSLGSEGAQESIRESVMQKALQELLTEKGIHAKEVNVCAPGFHVFSKFVKLPPVDGSKVTQIIQYEAQQNVPFPLAEVVWDYQILGSAPTGEMEVLLVAIKAEIIEGLSRTVESAGLRMQLADVSPAALCNAFRYNYSDLEDCTMLLDIGAKTSNLLFFEKGKVYSRSINLGANSITQDFANESKLPFAEAEKKKISEGFVSLGGAYEEPENAHQAAISKIARQFMTRLHIQVNQTMQFYRGQQGGSAPQRLFLSGGASLMPYTAQFFAEKLNVPVEYFNPFRNVQIDPAINLEELARVAHSLGEVVGLGLRNLAHCPVELNLMPESTLNRIQFNEKKPYLMATSVVLVVALFTFGFLFQRLANLERDELKKVHGVLGPFVQRDGQFKQALADRDRSRAEAEQFAGWISARYYWADALTALHQVMIRVEAATSKQLHTDTGIWIENLISDSGTIAAGNKLGLETTTLTSDTALRKYEDLSADEQVQMRAWDHEHPNGPPWPGLYAKASISPPDNKSTQPAPNESGNIFLLCRGVDVSKESNIPSANHDILYVLVDTLKASPDFDANSTRQSGDLTSDPSGTFTFGVTLKLKQPLKL